MTVNKSIDRCYIINLERRPDKRAHMLTEITKVQDQIDCAFFDAVDGANNTHLAKYSYNCAQWFDPSTSKAITVGEIGCALSHYSIWMTIKDEVLAGTLRSDCNVLILEDDVVFVDNFVSKYNQYITELNEQPDLLYLHRKILQPNLEQRVSTHITRPAKSYWTCGYIVSYQGVVKLTDTEYVHNLIPVDEYLPIMYGCPLNPYDRLYRSNPKLNCYAFSPSILSLLPSAPSDSETFKSDPAPKLMIPYSYEHNGIVYRLSVVYSGPHHGDSYERFVDYCKIYGLVYVDIAINDLPDYLTRTEPEHTVLLLLIANHDHCKILPISSPNELMTTYFDKCMNNYDVVFGDATVDNSVAIYLGMYKAVVKSYSDNLEPVSTIIESVVHPLISPTFSQYTTRIVYPRWPIMPCILFAFPQEQCDRSSIILNRIENYTGNNWNSLHGYCRLLRPVSMLPKIYISFITVIGASNNHNEFISTVNYPANLMHVQTNAVCTEDIPGICCYPTINDLYIRDMQLFVESDCDYYMLIDHNVVFTNTNVIQHLLSIGKNVVAPMLRKTGYNWTNFWGDITDTGYYSRSDDYFDIICNRKLGCWNVPYVTSSMLVTKESIKKIINKLTPDAIHIEMALCQLFRAHDIFMYVSNLVSYGYINPEPVVTSMTTQTLTIGDLVNTSYVTLWEQKYLHPDYVRNKLNLSQLPVKELCDNIYSFPLFSQTFCTELINLSEAYGNWSSGGNNKALDPRLGKSYVENVPTVDIQMFELGLQEQWKKIVFSYIAPVAAHLYNDYKTMGINLAFVVKYDTDNQSRLSPHHDASSYTVNIALNRGNGIDYDGGGCRFIRQNYILKNQEPGMCCIHPGRLTAYHEGLPVTSGRRYILVSFVN